MEEYLLLGSEFVLAIGFIGLFTGCYALCFLHYEKKNLEKFIEDTINEKFKKN